MTPDNSELDFQTICEVCNNMGRSQSLALQFLTRHVDKFVYYFKTNTRGRLFAVEVYFLKISSTLMLCSVVLWASRREPLKRSRYTFLISSFVGNLITPRAGYPKYDLLVNIWFPSVLTPRRITKTRHCTEVYHILAFIVSSGDGHW